MVLCSNGHLFCKLCLISYISKFNQESTKTSNNESNICHQCPIDNEINKSYVKCYFACLKIKNLAIDVLCPTLMLNNELSL